MSLLAQRAVAPGSTFSRARRRRSRQLDRARARESNRGVRRAVLRTRTRTRTTNQNREPTEPSTENREPRTSRSPVDTSAQLQAAPLDDDPWRVVARPDRFVHRQYRREVREVEDLQERLDPRAAVAERASDARVQGLHVIVILRRRIDE